MKKRALSILLVFVMLLGVLPMGIAAAAEAKIPYAVEGGNIYFDKETGVITGCDQSVTKAKIPAKIAGVNVEQIGYAAFRKCTALTEISFPDSLTTFGIEAFYGCSSLQEIELPNNTTLIANYAFASCTKLTEITIPSSVVCIMDGAFKGCTALQEVSIFGNINSIYGTTFLDCSALRSVTISASVSSIKFQAFRNCINLREVYFLGDAPEIASDAFDFYYINSGEYEPIPVIFHYIAGKEGWTSPTYEGYSTAKWLGYIDVSLGAWYAYAVEYAVTNGLMNGMSAMTFEPETGMTRAMLVTVLWRYAGEPIEGTNGFTDVASDQWYTNAVAWAAHNGIVGGVGNNKFDPNGKITREQLATILYRYAGSQLIETSARADLSAFPDGNKVSSWASDAMRWAVAEGLINGSDGKLLPQGNATRAQVATILMRFIENVAK